MHLLNRRTVLTAAAAGAGALALGGRAMAAPVDHALFTASPGGFFVDSVIVVGDESALVIDAQFTKPDATALADQIAATGKRLETIFITHIHPDHLMGIAVLTRRFPEARVVAHPAVAELLGQIGPGLFDARRGLGGYDAEDALVIPSPVEGPLTLEGESFEILGPMRGDTALVTPVALPQFDTIVASDVVYNGVDIWVAETLTAEDFAGWRAALDLLEARPEARLIPGHLGEGTEPDESGIAFTRRQLDLWETALGASSDRESLAAAIKDVMGIDPETSFFHQYAIAQAYPG